MATATASAALLGLIFVAISLHVDQVESNAVLRNRARINLQGLAVLLAICLCILIPQQSNVWLGGEIIGAIAIYWLLGVIGVVRANTAMGRIPRTVWIRLITQNSMSLLTLAAGISLVVNWGPGLILQAPVVIVGLPIATFNAWSVIYAPEIRGSRERESSRGRRR